MLFETNYYGREKREEWALTVSLAPQTPYVAFLGENVTLVMLTRK